MTDHPFQKVLIVDDNPLMLVLLDKLLTADGYKVFHATNGFEALDKMRQVACDFVIADWHMPQMSGLELCRQLRALELPNYVFFAILTSSDRPEDLILALDSGADDFYRKPVIAGELLARLRAGKRFLTQERRLRELARQDPLTEAINRRSFGEVLLREWNLADRLSTNLSCVMLDVDHFKTVNDRFGHPAGDTVLREITRVLREVCRVTDYLCRYGGEEFSILLPNTDEEGALTFAERCRTAILQGRFLAADCEIRVTASLGVAQRNLNTPRPDDLICHADQALMWAKRRGRNRVYSYSHSQSERQALIAAALEFQSYCPNRDELEHSTTISDAQAVKMS